MSKKKYRFKDHTEIKREHVQPVIDLLRAWQLGAAEEALRELCLSVKDLKHFEAKHLAMKIVADAGLTPEQLRQMMRSVRGQLCYPRGGGPPGEVTGRTRSCLMEGCLGQRLGVRWPGGKITWPCTKGMKIREEDGQWEIV